MNRFKRISLFNIVIRNFCATSKPDEHTFPLLLKKFSKSTNKNPYHIHAQVLKFGLYHDPFVMNSLVSAYAKAGYLHSSTKVFDEIFVKDIVSWTAAIDGYVKNNLPNQGLDCFMRMRALGVQVDGMIAVSLLRAAGMVDDVWFGKWIHGFYVEAGRVRYDVYVGAALIDMYVKCGVCDDARQVLDEMPERNIVCWSALIAGYVQCSRFKEALVLFQDMLVEKVEPNQVTLSTVLTACTHVGALDQGKWIHGYIKRKRLVLNMIVGTALIDFYAKCGCIQESYSIFQKLHDKNVYCWTAMINGMAMHGDAVSALNLFSRMLLEGVQPNGVTFIAILCACCHGGLVDEGRRYFESMTRVYGIKPNVNHYGCLVDLLGRAGHLEEALYVIERMPVEPSPGLWGALFNACIVHKNYELGIQLGEYLIKLQPNHSGRYMLLANLYSMCEKWEEASRIRKLMKREGVLKSPGCSLMEVNGAIHEFTSLEKMHSQSEDIYVMLHGLNLQLEHVGFEPDNSLLAFHPVGG